MAKWSGIDFRGVQDFETMGIKLNRAFNAAMNYIDHNNIPQIYTNYCNIQSENGELQIDGPTMRFYGDDTTLQRMNVGLSTVTNDFGLIIWNSAGGVTAYIDSTGEFIVRRVISGYVEGSTIVGSYIKTASTGARYELYGNEFIGYNGSNLKHGLEVNSSFADLYLNYEGVCIFSIINEIGGISFKYSSTTFMTSAGNETYMYGNWYLGGSDSTSIIKPQGYIDSNFVSDLAWDNATRTLSLKNKNGTVLASVVISS